MGSISTTRWFSTKEAADYLRIHPDTLRRLRRQGRGPRYAQPAPRFIRYSLEALDEWLTSGEGKGLKGGAA